MTAVGARVNDDPLHVARHEVRKMNVAVAVVVGEISRSRASVRHGSNRSRNPCKHGHRLDRKLPIADSSKASRNRCRRGWHSPHPSLQPGGQKMVDHRFQHLGRRDHRFSEQVGFADQLLLDRGDPLDGCLHPKSPRATMMPSAAFNIFIDVGQRSRPFNLRNDERLMPHLRRRLPHGVDVGRCLNEGLADGIDPFSSANFRHSRSRSVNAQTPRFIPGRFSPFRERNSPPTSTRHSTSLPETLTTSSRMLPSLRKMQPPGFTTAAGAESSRRRASGRREPCPLSM